MLKGKSAVITGGSNGIGKGIVEAFIAAGANVFFTANKDTEAAQALLDNYQDIPTKLNFMQLDAADINNAGRLLAKSTEYLGRVDILVNNLATTTRSKFLDITLDEYAKIMDVNLRFPFFTIQKFSRHMINKGIAGSIINISSISASKAISAMAHYQCSKAGLTMLTRSASYELAEHKIRVNTISPGLTATNANKNQWNDDPNLWATRGKDIPLGRTGLPKDHAQAAVFLASDQASWMTGADLVIDGGEAVI